MSESVRTFVALQVPDETGDDIWTIQDSLRHLPPMRDLRWSDPYESHITLKFLGDTPISRLPALVDALDGVAAQWEPFLVRLGQLGAFPNVHRPNVLWLGVEEGEKALQHLYNAVEVALKKVGVKPERGDYHPHLTLARIPRSWTQGQRRAVGELIGPTGLPASPSFTARAIALIRSDLTPQGPHYMRLGNALFGAAPPLQDDEWEDIP